VYDFTYKDLSYAKQPCSYLFERGYNGHTCTSPFIYDSVYGIFFLQLPLALGIYSGLSGLILGPILAGALFFYFIC